MSAVLAVVSTQWTATAFAGEAQAAAPKRKRGLRVRNGWYAHDGKLIWGYAQHNGWWGAYRANITRDAGARVGPNRTEDLDKLTDAMGRFGYPAFEHNYGLWYDRRRDRHDTARRSDGNVVGPLLAQPWGRSGLGKAWDGLTWYDLLKFNPWYFRRLKQFADLCDRKGTILLHNFYMQHALLETNAHYADFPWRPVNCIQKTDLPDRTPAANAFYDVSHPLRRKLHRAYIRKCLDVLGRNTNVIHLCSQEYTGGVEFMRFWLDTVFEWEARTGRDVHVAVSGSKDVLDAILADPVRGPKVESLGLRYWWYLPNGRLHAPKGGRQMPGRYAGGAGSAKTTPWQIHRQVREYRRKYPDKGILHTINADRRQTCAVLMGGGSLLVRCLQYTDRNETKYVAPAGVEHIRPTYDFLRTHLAEALLTARPAKLTDRPQENWCLADPGRTYLIYALRGGTIRLNLAGAQGQFECRWFNPHNGALTRASRAQLAGGKTVVFQAPSLDDWFLLLTAAKR